MVGWILLTGPRLGHPEEFLVGNFWNGPQLGKSEGFLVGKNEIEAIEGADGDVIGRSERGHQLVKRMGPGLENM